MSIEDVKIVEAMLKYGGGFANALAKAAIRSDEDNLRRIKGIPRLDLGRHSGWRSPDLHCGWQLYHHTQESCSR